MPNCLSDQSVCACVCVKRCANLINQTTSDGINNRINDETMMNV